MARQPYFYIMMLVRCISYAPVHILLLLDILMHIGVNSGLLRYVGVLHAGRECFDSHRDPTVDNDLLGFLGAVVVSGDAVG